MLGVLPARALARRFEVSPVRHPCLRHPPQKSGIDLFELADGRITTVWSVKGLRRLAD
ncbi:hypothetical protein [Streptomyces herbicida]|uniref:hypothetical protein n=1 Tax=Streptomyces herbicida TaxID=3065675 RepID=UPI00292FCA37|nr:hypothetical protein [Streptomyces sp. NEAU-HV9]